MKRSLLVVSLFLHSIAHSATYYFSVGGNDSYTAAQAQNPSTPWKSIDKLNASYSVFQPGDVIAFKRGETFYGSINVAVSGSQSAPITFTAFGSGNKPVITGFATLTGWTAAGSNKYEATTPSLGANLNMVVVNGVSKAAGRYPNPTAANKGYLYFQSASGNTSITHDALSGSNYNDGEVVIRKTRWVLDRNKIQSHNGSVITYTSQSGYAADQGFGYFIQNHPATLDVENEWYYNAANRKFGIFASSGAASLNMVQVASVDVLVQVQGQSNITFDNLSFSGSNTNTFYLKNAGQLRVTNCDLLYNGRNAFTAENTNNITVEQCTIDQTNNIAFHGNGSNYTTIKSNRISNTGVLAGMGDGDAGSYEGLMISGNNNTITLNEIKNTGYIPITFSGDAIVIAKNFISDYAYVKDDGGGIYTWNNGPNPPQNVNRTISENIVLNGLGAPEGTSDISLKFAHGIYIDDNSKNVNIDGNTVANCGSYGLYIHNARDLSITKNLVYNNRVQIVMQHDDIAPNSPVANNTVSGNNFFALQPNQVVAEYKTRNDDLANFGTFNNNYYVRPFDNTAIINTLKRVNGTYQFQPVDLEGWKGMHGKDLTSASTPKEFKPYTIHQLLGANKYANGTFNSGISGLYAYANANNVSTTWKSNELDGGTLQVSFSGTAAINNKGTLIVGIGQVTANKSYNVKFSMRGTPNLRMLDVYLRKSQSPYNDITDRKVVKVTADRKEVSLVFTASETQSDASIGIDIPEEINPFYIDNLQIFEANATPANPQDSIRFLYNATDATTSVALSTSYIDAAGKPFNNSISLPGFGSAVLLQGTTTAVATTTAQCAGTGTILHEQWDNVAGNTIASNNYNNPVSNSSQLSLFEAPSHKKDNYASRIRGYICAPQSGNYTFWIAGDDETELYLSTDANPANKVKIAYNVSWAAEREWYKYPTQQSAVMYLEAGMKYYIEALHKEGSGGDNLAVAWRLPSGEMEAPIPGTRLSPFLFTSAPLLAQTISINPITDYTIGGAPFPLVAAASSGLPVSFRVVSGNATIAGNMCTVAGTGTIVIEASQAGNTTFAPAPVVSRSFIATADLSASCAATGFILREQWNNVSGNTISDNNWNNPPSGTSLLSLFEAPSHIADNYASRIRGYICPPQTGNYTFFIAGDDAAELYLSNNADPASKVKIAFNVSWAGEREWSNNPSQQSAAIYLEGGKRYYVEALHKEGAGGDNLAVAWKLPNGVFEAPIPGKYLSPFTATTTLATQTITFLQPADVVFGSAPVTLVATSSSGLPVAFKVGSGPGTLSGNVLTATSTGTIVVEASQAGNTAYSPASVVGRNVNVVAGNSCSATGSILREVWNNVWGNNIWDNNWSAASHSTTVLSLFEGPANVADNYASRIRGYICPPQDGSYTFWIAGDDASELYLSTDEFASNKIKIAHILSWTNPREWNKFASQKSAAINLKAGKRYYIEAIHKEGNGGDNLAVGWEMPGGVREMPIPGSRLSNFQPITSLSKATASKQKPVAAEEPGKLQLFPNPVSNNAQIVYKQQHSGMLTIVLEDVQGRVIRRLFQGNVSAGITQTIQFNSKGIAPGMYTVHLFAPQQEKSLKVLIAQ